VLAWLDDNLDPSLATVTFVGQLSQPYRRIRHVGPLDSDGVARLLREHDVYLAASRDDPCSNALLEALACGLPAAYLASGGHPELVGDAGVPFESPEDVPDALLHLASDLDGYRSRIGIPSLASIADRYLEVLGLAAEGRP
jgi:glycosyltransferase involved in cell wall biosynthesis